jgi:ADP-ribose pyrophosphatase
MKDLDQNSPEGLIETCISSEYILQSRWMHVKRDTVQLPSGNTGQREFLIHPGAVIVIPVFDDGTMLFERQFRYPLNQIFIELPAGKIDPGEDVLVTGQRELLEETGYSAKDWVYLGLQHPCIGYSTEIIHMYLARGLEAGVPSRDEDEALQLMTMTQSEALSKIQSGEITDGKTIIALMWAEKYLNGTWRPMTINDIE